jgi:hypothetical protein
LEFYQHVAYGKRQSVYVLFNTADVFISEKSATVFIRFGCVAVVSYAIRGIDELCL